jgi:hypothetical protein
MRILLVTAAAMIAPASAAAPPAPTTSKIEPAKAPDRPKAECRTSTVHQASPFNRADPVRPRKLGELPPATGYKAVYRTIDGCEVPMTVAEYQRAPGR